MTIRTELSSFYNGLLNAENNTLGFLGNPEATLENYESFLTGLNLSISRSLLTQRIPKNGSYVEGNISLPIFLLASIKRDLAMRKMTRKDYYLNAGGEIQDEISRLERTKIGVIQSIAGNMPVNTRGQ